MRLVFLQAGVEGVQADLQRGGRLPLVALELVERFTPISADVLQYEVAVHDPKTWAAPWKVAFPLKRESDYQFFEYACHEGNNAMRNILSGSRADERAAAGK